MSIKEYPERNSKEILGIITNFFDAQLEKLNLHESQIIAQNLPELKESS